MNKTVLALLIVIAALLIFSIAFSYYALKHKKKQDDPKPTLSDKLQSYPPDLYRLDQKVLKSYCLQVAQKTKLLARTQSVEGWVPSEKDTGQHKWEQKVSDDETKSVESNIEDLQAKINAYEKDMGSILDQTNFLKNYTQRMQLEDKILSQTISENLLPETLLLRVKQFKEGNWEWNMAENAWENETESIEVEPNDLPRKNLFSILE